MDNAKRVGIWIRVSTEDQAKGESPEHHEKRARLYAESKGWQVCEVYHLEAVSGKSVMHHPEAKRMLEDIRRDHISGLIFSKLARLARNTKELLEFAEMFNECGADLVSLQEAIDTSTPAGRLFYTMIAAMAQWEREEIASRVAASVPIRAKLGKPLGGQAPFGYRWDNRVLVPDPTEAPVRKLIYELFLEHRRKKRVARLLNEAGYRTRNSSQFSDMTIGRLLRDPTAKGLHRANYTKQSSKSGKVELKPEDEWVYSEVEAIVSNDLWTECNLILDEQKKKNKRPARKTAHLFSGIVLCGCGGKMYVPSNSPKYICSKCRNKIPTDDLEHVFQEQLRSFFFSRDEIAGYLGQADKVIKEKAALLQVLVEEEDKIKQQMDQVYRLYIDKEISTKGFGQRYKPLEERLGQLQEQIPEVQAETDFLKIQYSSSDEVLHEARDLYSRWSELTEDDKRKIVETITERITVTDGEVVIDLCYLPTSPELMTTSHQNQCVALPFCHVTLKQEKPRSAAYPTEIKTLGDHLRRRRLDLGLSLREAASILGTNSSSVCRWESGKTEKPVLRLFPKIIKFLGYVPYVDQAQLSLGQKIMIRRRMLGLTQRQFAKLVKVDPSTAASWEKDGSTPARKHAAQIESFLAPLTSGALEIEEAPGPLPDVLTSSRSPSLADS